MTQTGTPNPGWLDAYLDGALEAAQARAFEAWLATPEGSGTRGALELQREIDRSLRGVMAPPASMPGIDVLRHATRETVAPEDVVAGRISREGTEHGNAGIDAVGRSGAGGGSGAKGRLAARTRRWALAAAVLLAGTVFVVSRLASGGSGLLDPDALYASLIDRGYKFTYACETDSEFAGVMHTHTNEWLVVTPQPGLSVLGWRYGYNSGGGVLSPDDLILMTRVAETGTKDSVPESSAGAGSASGGAGEGREVVVLVDKGAKARRIREGRWGNLNVFRREMGSAVLYEVTPLERATVLPRFAEYAGEKPAPGGAATQPPAGG